MMTTNEMVWKDEKSAAEAVKHLESEGPLLIKVTERRLVGLLNELVDQGEELDVAVTADFRGMIKNLLSRSKSWFSLPQLFLVATFTKRTVSVHYDPKTKTWKFEIQRKE